MECIQDINDIFLNKGSFHLFFILVLALIVQIIFFIQRYLRTLVFIDEILSNSFLFVEIVLLVHCNIWEVVFVWISHYKTRVVLWWTLSWWFWLARRFENELRFRHKCWLWLFVWITFLRFEFHIFIWLILLMKHFAFGLSLVLFTLDLCFLDDIHNFVFNLVNIINLVFFVFILFQWSRLILWVHTQIFIYCNVNRFQRLDKKRFYHIYILSDFIF